MANNIEYNEIASAKVSDTRSIVISECSKGGYTVAQRIEIEESNGVTPVYMKGAFHVSDIEGLCNIRDVINLSIDIINERESENETWDDEWYQIINSDII